MPESTKTQQPVDSDLKDARQKTGMIGLPQRWDRFEPLAEILAILILATATLATAWSGYQSARWSGVQAADYSRAGATRVESSRASAIAGQQMQIDIGLFTNWINAYAVNNQQLADFYRARFRDEFNPAFDAWLLTNPKNNPGAPKSPFAMPEYSLAKNEEADSLEIKAGEYFNAAESANEIADRYVLDTVILASVLFLAGMASQVKAVRVKTGVVIFALLILAWGIYSIIILPIE
jgi:hypothetical protein